MNTFAPITLVCSQPGCGVAISNQSRTGKCRRHCQPSSHGAGRKAKPILLCSICGGRISAYSLSGKCRACVSASRAVPRPKCLHPGCDVILSLHALGRSATGFCRVHAHKVRPTEGGGPVTSWPRGRATFCPIGRVHPGDIMLHIPRARAMGARPGVETVMLAAMIACGVAL